MIGIYEIKNISNGFTYIGKSRNIPERWKQHKRALDKNQHHNHNLQLAWNEYGASSFKFSVIELASQCYLNCYEKSYINYYKSLGKSYNISENLYRRITRLIVEAVIPPYKFTWVNKDSGEVGSLVGNYVELFDMGYRVGHINRAIESHTIYRDKWWFKSDIYFRRSKEGGVIAARGDERRVFSSSSSAARWIGHSTDEGVIRAADLGVEYCGWTWSWVSGQTYSKNYTKYRRITVGGMSFGTVGEFLRYAESCLVDGGVLFGEEVRIEESWSRFI